MITDKQKIAKYEELLHKIQLNAEVCLNDENMRRLISNICDWSYAHRRGNGELTDEEQQNCIDKCFNKLTNLE